MRDFKGKMSIKFKKTTDEETVLLHDFYFSSVEPDAPKSLFKNLNDAEKSQAFNQFPVENYFTLVKEKELVGFVGFFPDDDLNVNIFYVLSPDHRGKGYFKEILDLSIDYCQKHFSQFNNIRALTRKQNLASIKGLERCCFERQGQVIEEVQPDVAYEEYVFPIRRHLSFT